MPTDDVIRTTGEPKAVPLTMEMLTVRSHRSATYLPSAGRIMCTVRFSALLGFETVLKGLFTGQTVILAASGENHMAVVNLYVRRRIDGVAGKRERNREDGGA